MISKNLDCLGVFQQLPRLFIKTALFCGAGIISNPLLAETTHVVTASNFAQTLDVLVADFTAATGHQVRVSSASTGTLYAQIVNGAPFDIFLAADVERPRAIESKELSVPGSRFSYAFGRLVLWSNDASLAGKNCRMVLESADFNRLAIANPEIAPYGAAARHYLSGLDAWPQIEKRLVFGQNIAQTMQFAASGNATLGLIAAAQALDLRLPEATCEWPVPTSAYTPIEQQAVLLKRAKENQAAVAFVAYLQSSAGMDLIERAGYAVVRPQLE
jgi:molybdate transport system substrate-binding protein